MLLLSDAAGFGAREIAKLGEKQINVRERGVHCRR